MLRSVIAVVAMILVSCGDSKDDNEQPPVVEEKEVAACTMLTFGGFSLKEPESSETTPVVACFESQSQLTTEWCETSGTKFDSEGYFYQLFKGQDYCPTENLVGKCVYPATERQEAVTLWYYSHSEVNTDLERVKRACNLEGMFFELN